MTRLGTSVAEDADSIDEDNVVAWPELLRMILKVLRETLELCRRKWRAGAPFVAISWNSTAEVMSSTCEGA